MKRHFSAGDDPHWQTPADIYSSANLRGSYNPLHFVVRLHPELHDLLKSRPTGFFSASTFEFEHLSAFSTYLHETIHWWQHIGSTTGLLLSLAYPAQCHVNRAHLLEVLKDVGPKKSLRTLLSQRSAPLPRKVQDRLNIVINNWHDTQFNNTIIIDPFQLEDIAKNPFFDCVGHSLTIGLTHALWLLTATFDQQLEVFPDFRQWEPPLQELRTKEVEGFYFGSPIKRVPLGALHIFEGQARFCQLQYLYLATNGSYSWSDFESSGMMGDRYVRAFKRFLEWSGFEWPDSPVDPVVNLFLLICDVSINPSEGYPFNLDHFETFIISVDPGFRFFMFAREVSRRKSLGNAVRSCSRAEYLEVSSLLVHSLVCQNPVEISEKIVKMSKASAKLQELLDEDRTFRFGNENLPVRLYFAKHIRFAEDRMRAPEFFCWPAIHMVLGGDRGIDPERSMQLWQEHEPVFVADLEGEIRPVLARGRAEEDIYSTFNRFFEWNVVYDLTTQWMMEDGPFSFDYRWITPKYSAEELRRWASERFRQSFEVSPDEFEILPDGK